MCSSFHVFFHSISFLVEIQHQLLIMLGIFPVRFQFSIQSQMKNVHSQTYLCIPKLLFIILVDIDCALNSFVRIFKSDFVRPAQISTKTDLKQICFQLHQIYFRMVVTMVWGNVLQYNFHINKFSIELFKAMFNVQTWQKVRNNNNETITEANHM